MSVPKPRNAHRIEHSPLTLIHRKWTGKGQLHSQPKHKIAAIPEGPIPLPHLPSPKRQRKETQLKCGVSACRSDKGKCWKSRSSAANVVWGQIWIQVLILALPSYELGHVPKPPYNSVSLLIKQIIIAKLTGLSEGLSGIKDAKNLSAYRKPPGHGGYYLKYQEMPLHNVFSFLHYFVLAPSLNKYPSHLRGDN